MSTTPDKLRAISNAERNAMTACDKVIVKLQRLPLPTKRKIKSIRKQARMTQAEFARLLDVSTGTISKWESGQLTPHGPAARLLKIIMTKGLVGALS